MLDVVNQPEGRGRPDWAMIAVVVAILTQSAVLIIWGAQLDQRVGSLESKVTASDGLAETVARVDERTAGLVTTVNRIDQRITERERMR